ncbi:hypothetical protein TCAL_00314 [Tigriopus californicus]|uniref:Uncharacterized protein n=1 Tax=Tigriopus californicus TaxID=6832 RepID=A0A553NEV0_TIGCA|nr:hypothetical protein TCAL_00314 [Tigriopus californicus]|eukprot:TCALIF_00314-PA protein Name:"Similar to ASB3 Ankyrin repeat and SOCS box protein 3 (Homo sapiens)" AED:0.62 eAED:0.64 QI:0/-1/0/1/-1/1/1/0/655
MTTKPRPQAVRVEKDTIMDFDGVYEHTVPPVSKFLRFSDNADDLEQLIHQEGQSAVQVDNRGWQPIHYAAFLNRSQCLKVLLAAPLTNVNAKTFENLTPLMLACSKSRDALDTIQLLLDHPEIRSNEKDNMDYTALHRAAKLQDGLVCGMLIGKGADVHASSFHGETPLISAFMETQSTDVGQRKLIKILKTLLREGADPMDVAKCIGSPYSGYVQSSMCRILKRNPKAIKFIIDGLSPEQKDPFINGPPDEKVRNIFTLMLVSPHLSLGLYNHLVQEGADLQKEIRSLDHLPVPLLPIHLVIYNNHSDINMQGEILMKMIPATHKRSLEDPSIPCSDRISDLANLPSVDVNTSVLWNILDKYPVSWILKFLTLKSPWLKPNGEYIRLNCHMSKTTTPMYKAIACHFNGSVEDHIRILSRLTSLGWSLESPHPKVLSPIYALFYKEDTEYHLAIAKFLVENGATLTRAEMKAVIRTPQTEFLVQMVNLNLIDSAVFGQTFKNFLLCIERHPTSVKCIGLAYLIALLIRSEIKPLPTVLIQRFHCVLYETIPEFPFKFTILDQIYERSMTPCSLQQMGINHIRDRFWRGSRFDAAGVRQLGLPLDLCNRVIHPSISSRYICEIATQSESELNLTVQFRNFIHNYNPGRFTIPLEPM